MLNTIKTVLLYVLVVVAVCLGIWIAVKLWQKAGFTAKIVKPILNWFNKAK